MLQVDKIKQENDRIKIELEEFQKKYHDLENFARSIGKLPKVKFKLLELEIFVFKYINYILFFIIKLLMLVWILGYNIVLYYLYVKNYCYFYNIQLL